eukprot:83074-Pyramimonas_sp.AAC.1
MAPRQVSAARVGGLRSGERPPVAGGASTGGPQGRRDSPRVRLRRTRGGGSHPRGEWPQNEDLEGTLECPGRANSPSWARPRQY